RMSRMSRMPREESVLPAPLARRGIRADDRVPPGTRPDPDDHLSRAVPVAVVQTSRLERRPARALYLQAPGRACSAPHLAVREVAARTLYIGTLEPPEDRTPGRPDP